jgi:hypothetical protein
MINGIFLIIVLQVVVVMLTSCTMLEEKMQHLQCDAPVDSSLCVGWKV